MPVMKRLKQYLKRRGDRWNYHRRVPAAYQTIDPRGTIRVALDTASIEIARARRDALAKADELFWRTLQSGKPTTLDSYETLSSEPCLLVSLINSCKTSTQTSV